MNYIDMHCDTLSEALVRGQKTAKSLEGTMVDVERLKRSGAAAQFFAMFLPQKESDRRRYQMEAGIPQLNMLLEKMYEIYQNTLSECSDILAPAYRAEDLEKNRKEGKLSAFLTIENGAVAEGKLENIERFYQKGVRLITLTWNDENCFGYPHSSHREEMRRGLKPFGKEAVSYMEEQGILVDVSHLSDGGFYDVADIMKKPFVASHSNCRAITPATRNLTDDMIRVLAEHGGVAGINFEPTFLNGNPKDTLSRVERMCDHVEHFIRIGGVECVGIGTDFDGIGGQFEIADCTQMEKLFAALRKRGISEETLEKIAYRNVERVIREGM
ncbi:MAG: dipeptidase [Roseburia sp.]|nr:dipeptidase [Roseburia sp.]